MINQNLIDDVKNKISGISGITNITDVIENDGVVCSIRFTHEEKVIVIRIQDESKEDSEEYVFYIDYVTRINNISRKTNKTELLTATNEFNRTYSVNKCIFMDDNKGNSKKDGVYVFWFRSEFLIQRIPEMKIIEGTIKSLKNAPQLLIDIIKDK